MSRGKGHPNSNSAWGHEIAVSKWYDWGKPQFLEPEDVDPTTYEASDVPDEIRFFLVATLPGRVVIEGPGSPLPVLRLLYATCDGRRAVELETKADEIDGELVPIDEVKHAISRPIDDSSRVGVASNAQRYRDCIRRSHQ